MGLGKHLTFFILFFISGSAFADYKSDFKILTKKVFNSNQALGCKPLVIASLESSFQNLLKESFRPANGRIALAKNLSIEYLKCKRVQEAIWTYSLGGYYGFSKELSNYLRQTLESNDFKVLGLIGEGVSRGSFIQFSNGIEAVLKPADRNWQNSTDNEVFAYDFDIALDFNHVPMTVFNRFEDQKVSVQFKMLNSYATKVSYLGGAQKDYPLVEEVFFFDYLLANSDRHGLNSLFTAEKYLVLIDNGRIFNIPNMNTEAARALGIEVPKRLIKKLPQVKAAILRGQYNEYVPEEKRKELLERIEMMQQTFHSKIDTRTDCDEALGAAA